MSADYWGWQTLADFLDYLRGAVIRKASGLPARPCDARWPVQAPACSGWSSKVFNEAFEYYSRLQQEGEIESFEPVILEPHGGELGGFFLLRGDQDKLARIRSSEEFERRTVRGDLIVENLGIVGAALGDRLMSQMAVYGEQVEELT